MSADVGEDGFVTRIRIDPRAMRLGSEDLAERLLRVVRAAQASHVAPPAFDPGDVARRLDELEIQAARDFEHLTALLDDTIRKLGD
ncbi:hypothetical protein [Nonomuraea sediminis]|uniref:hypothetical protein n=1 Tax=Nonomuraea sediminis TaxID=2835864 RepID=UPI001BDC1D1E|nr:hypothetical protein [Nonomuraea sediminis]